ncbi:hypothetical protein CTAYLR_004639 [Chrysophaeum taylorii]|uniref:Aminotransferase class I/classII large domain-containing protein n=1 Tax=Chrysophaeum taylorii TaxID=2483200 RepID=A0AAD7UQJ3_9STRA|nr:hypothetical protein CTAYLR_004639 [Chrysophaeum taylorii]
MGQGYPDFLGSEVARRAAAEALKEAALNQYSAPRGLPQLREAVASWHSRRYGSKQTAEDVVVTAGGQEALVCAIRAGIEASGRSGGVVVMEPFYPFLGGVVVMEPFYPFLGGAVSRAGGIAMPMRLEAPEFRIRGVELLDIPENAFVVADEVYEGTAKHRRVASVVDPQRVITVGSAGKLLSLTGWRVGWIVASNRELADRAAAAHLDLTYAAPTPLQAGVARALDEDDLGGVGALFKQNYEKLEAALPSSLKARGGPRGYFLVAEIIDGTDDLTFVERLAESTGVVAAPLRVFYADPPPTNLVRFTNQHTTSTPRVGAS